MRTESARSRTASTNLILAAVLFGLCGFVYWYEFQSKPERERAAEAKTKLLTLDQTREVESLRIVDKAKGIDFQLRCKSRCKMNDPGAEWEIEAPISFKADEGNVGTFITSVAGATIQDTLALDGDVEARLKDYGLAKEVRDLRKAVFKFKSDAEPYSLYVGDASAVGENVYVYFEGPGEKRDVLRIVPGYLKNNLERNLSYWRAKRLFHVGASEIASVRISNPVGGATLTKDGSSWVLEGKKLADNEAVDTFLTGLVFMNAQDYVSDDVKKDRAKLKLTGKPKYSITLKAGNKPAEKIDIYDVLLDSQPKLYATLDGKPFVVELDRTHAEKFGKTNDSFRFRNLITAAEKQEIKKVQVALQGGKEKVELDDKDAATLDQVLTKVGAARIAEFMGHKPVPGGNSELTSWTLLDKEGKKLRDFKVYGTDEKGEYYLKLPGGELAKLERGSGSAIPRKAADFQKAAKP